MRYTDPTGNFINGFMFGILGVGLAALYLGVQGDKVAHFWSGVGTNAVVGLALLLFPSAHTASGIVLAIAVSFLIGTLFELFWFNAGGFDRLDWIAQNLGVGVSLMLWLMILSRFSPVAEMGMEIINHLIYWSLFLMVFSVIVYHASESIRKRFPRP